MFILFISSGMKLVCHSWNGPMHIYMRKQWREKPGRVEEEEEEEEEEAPESPFKERVEEEKHFELSHIHHGTI